MRTFARYALGIAAAAVVLSGCGGSQPLFGAPGVPMENRVAASESGDLLYAAGEHYGYVFTYPKGRLVQTFKLQIHGQRGSANGLCSDSSGNVFIAAFSASFTKVFEYAHGGTKPIAQLDDPQPTAIACASDSATGNLAVTNSFPTEGLESVAIYSNARGKPKLYYTIPKMNVYGFCAYDDAGDLFVDGQRLDSRFVLAELPKGGHTFRAITVKGLDTRNPGNLQWAGSHLTVAVPTANAVYALSISGTTGTIVGTTMLHGWDTRRTSQSWIQGNKVIAPSELSNTTIAFWNYPQGGKSVKVLSGFAAGYIHGVTVSAVQTPPRRPSSTVR